MKPYFITTAIPYVNAAPHLGFALEIIQADVLARYHRLQGKDVFFLTGTDENALKNVLTAEKAGLKVRDLADRNVKKFKELKEVLNISWDDFIRTTEERHIQGARKFWLACRKDIYKKKYRGLYCVGCEEFKTAKELTDERCPEHPDIQPEIVEEENYFFRLSAYQEQLRRLIDSDELNIIPAVKKNEIISFIDQGLRDFSISRSQERARGWGIPVPGDDSQIQYVWFDALTNYVNAPGYAVDSEKFRKYWERGHVIHVIGKSAARFHAIYWPAMLLSAGLSLPKQIFIHGYLMIDGRKISKSIGNVVSPAEMVGKYGVDAVRYYLLREITAFEDGDFSYQKFEERYNGELANGLGNFTARVLSLAEKIKNYDLKNFKDIDGAVEKKIKEIKKILDQKLEEFKFHEAVSAIWELISFGDKYLNKNKPWEKNNEKIVFNAAVILDNISALLRPFLPETAEKINSGIQWENNKLLIKKISNLFPRLY